jgi:lysophosphatidate acyltransferase
MDHILSKFPLIDSHLLSDGYALPLPGGYSALLLAAMLFIMLHPFYRKTFFIFMLVIPTAFYAFILCLVLGPTGKRASINYHCAKFFLRAGTFLTGVRIEVEGAEHLQKEEARVIVANHQSSLDVLIMTAIVPPNCVVIAKRSLRFIPLFGTYMVMARNILIDRKNHQCSMAMLSKAGESIKNEQLSVFVFPEGTRSRLAEASMLPFKKGAFHLAQQAQVPVVPAVFSNYRHIFNSTERIWRSGVIRVKILPPRSTEHLTPEKITYFMNEVREDMLKTLKEMAAEQQ